MRGIGAEQRLTVGQVHRHRPPASNVGLGIALLDIAQDFLLAHLHAEGLFDTLVTFKGGTAIRKLYAGHRGRFSTDMDLAVVRVDEDRAEVAALVADSATVELGPFRYRATLRRERWEVLVTSGLGEIPLAMKIDVGPPCWLRPERRQVIPQAVHSFYGFSMPVLPCMALEEVLAEKVARLARRSTARDAYDLVWCAETSPFSQFDRARVGRLAALKTWSDQQGLTRAWPQVLQPATLDPEKWLAPRPNANWDDEQIGMLTHPAPPLAKLGADLRKHYDFLRAMTAEERQWGRGDARDRGAVLRAVAALPDVALDPAQLR